MPPRTFRSAAARALLFIAGGAARGQAQQSPAPAPTYPNVRVTGRVQSQAYWFENDEAQAVTGPSSNFFLRRVRIEARGNITENVSFVIAPSFEGGRTLDVSRARGGVRLRDAFVDVRLTPADAATGLTVRMGQEKRPFGRYELVSSTNLPTIERGAGRGLVPGTATNDLFESAGYLSHDVGASVIVSAARERLAVRAGVYNGRGESLNDENDSKSFGARATYTVWRKLDVGASAYSRDFILPPAVEGGAPDSSFRVSAFGVDAQWGAPAQPGLFALVEGMSGDRPTAARGDMRGLIGVAAWHVRTGGRGLLWAWEPVVRFDRNDPDADADDDGQTLLGAGVGLYVSNRAHFRIMYERQSFESSTAIDPISGVRTQLAVSW